MNKKYGIKSKTVAAYKKGVRTENNYYIINI